MLCQAYFSVSSIAPADSLMSSGAFLKYRAEHGYIRLHVICIRFRPRNSLFLSHSNPERANRFTVCRQTYIIFENGVWGVAPRRVAGTPVPVFTPGTDAGRVCTRALHDAKPTKHTQPFTGERGQGDRDSKLEVCFQKQTFSTRWAECGFTFRFAIPIFLYATQSSTEKQLL